MIPAAARISRLLLTCLLLVASLQGKETFSFFVPPSGWDLVDPSLLSSTVKVGFVGPSKTALRPSINFVEEPTSLSLSEYMQAVRSLHVADRANRWRILGPLHTSAGKAVLTEIDTETPLGKVRLLQSILVKDGIAYILTGAMARGSFGLLQKEFIDSFRSLSITEDLSSSLISEKKSLFLEKSKLFSSGLISLSELKKTLSQEFKEEGSYWQILALKKLEQNALLEIR